MKVKKPKTPLPLIPRKPISEKRPHHPGRGPKPKSNDFVPGKLDFTKTKNVIYKILI